MTIEEARAEMSRQGDRVSRYFWVLFGGSVLFWLIVIAANVYMHVDVRSIHFIVSVVGLLLTVVVGYGFYSKVVSPVESIVRYLEEFVEKRMPPDRSIVEVGEQFSSFVDELQKFMDDFKKFRNELDNTHELIMYSSKETTQNYEALVRRSKEQNERAKAVSKALQDISTSIMKLSQNVQELVSTAEESSAAMEEMAASVHQVAKNAKSVAALSESTVRKAVESGEIVNDTIRGINAIGATIANLTDVINNLGAKSEKIGVIVKTISNISKQTNLLALNAAIEAARAGEHGKGFSVVAQQIRKLADDSSHSTTEISMLIGGIQDEVKNAIQSSENGRKQIENEIAKAQVAEAAVKDIINNITQVTNSMKEINTATQEQKAGSDQIVKGVEYVSSLTQQISLAIQEQMQNTMKATEDVDKISRDIAQNLTSLEDLSIVTSSIAEQSQAIIKASNRFFRQDDGGS